MILCFTATSVPLFCSSAAFKIRVEHFSHSPSETEDEEQKAAVVSLHSQWTVFP